MLAGWGQRDHEGDRLSDGAPGNGDIEQIALDVAELTREKGIIDQLTALLREPSEDPSVGAMSRSKAKSRPPWNPDAAGAYLTIHAGARELEQNLRYRVTGHTGEDRGGSTANTRAALAAITSLVYAVDELAVRDAANQVAAWLRAARQLRDIDRQDKWVPLPRVKGYLPPACDYCDTYSLRMNRRTGVVRCSNPACTDEDGNQPAARMLIGRYSGQGTLVWRDGREVVYTIDADSSADAA